MVAAARSSVSGRAEQTSQNGCYAAWRVGPVRMDDEKALGAVRSAATDLSRFVESIYDER